MTERTAQKVANVALSAAAFGATYMIARTPRLRRLAMGLAMTALTSALPAWLAREARHAWAHSGRREI